MGVDREGVGGVYAVMHIENIIENIIEYLTLVTALLLSPRA